MLSNPVHDPFIECGCLGYSLRAAAHKRGPYGFLASLEIRDFGRAGGRMIREEMFDVMFADPDSAMNWALGRGRFMAHVLRTNHLLNEMVGA